MRAQGIEIFNLDWGIWDGSMLNMEFEPDQERQGCFHK